MRFRILVASLLGCCAGVAGAASSSVIGETFPIMEPDTLEEIRAAARARDWQSWMRRAPADYGAFKSAELPRAHEDATRLFDPTYTLPDDIRGESGELLAAKGTQVNVYDRIQVPGRYIVVGPYEEDYRWLDEVAKPTANDKILLAGGNVFTERERTGRGIYLLDQRFIERFGLRAVPAIVRQEGRMLRIDEYALDK